MRMGPDRSTTRVPRPWTSPSSPCPRSPRCWPRPPRTPPRTSRWSPDRNLPLLRNPSEYATTNPALALVPHADNTIQELPGPEPPPAVRPNRSAPTRSACSKSQTRGTRRHPAPTRRPSLQGKRNPAKDFVHGLRRVAELGAGRATRTTAPTWSRRTGRWCVPWSATTATTLHGSCCCSTRYGCCSRS